MKIVVLGIVFALVLAVGTLFSGDAAFADNDNGGCKSFGEIMPPVTPGPEAGEFISGNANIGLWSETLEALKEANCT